MNTLLFINHFVLGAGGASLASGIRDFIGPLLMLAMGIVAITFLFKRQMTEFFVFLTICILVALIFYAPDIITSLAKSVNTNSGQDAQWTGK